MLRERRRRHLERGELGDQELDRLGVRSLVNAIQRLATPARKERSNGFVRDDHQLLDQSVGKRLPLHPCPLHPTPAVEGERELPGLDAQCSASIPTSPELGRELLGK